MAFFTKKGKKERIYTWKAKTFMKSKKISWAYQTNTHAKLYFFKSQKIQAEKKKYSSENYFRQFSQPHYLQIRSN